MCKHPDKLRESLSQESQALQGLTELMREISACREEISLREAETVELEGRIRREWGPLEAQALAVRVETFRVLGGHLVEGWLRRRFHKVLEAALRELADELEQIHGADLREERRFFFGDEPTVGRGHLEKFAQDGRERPQGEREWETPGDDFPGRDRQGRKRPSDATLPRDAKEPAFAGDIRALYLLLARALHPDKESDPARRGEKTVWMQKVTAAYESRDLARLLDILAENPLDAVGPYLSQAPLKTVRGFAKRLRRELAAMRKRMEEAGGRLHPYFRLLKAGRVDEKAFQRILAEMKKTVRFLKERRDRYRTREGVEELIDALAEHNWRELM